MLLRAGWHGHWPVTHAAGHQRVVRPLRRRLDPMHIHMDEIGNDLVPHHGDLAVVPPDVVRNELDVFRVADGNFKFLGPRRMHIDWAAGRNHKRRPANLALDFLPRQLVLEVILIAALLTFHLNAHEQDSLSRRDVDRPSQLGNGTHRNPTTFLPSEPRAYYENYSQRFGTGVSRHRSTKLATAIPNATLAAITTT